MLLDAVTAPSADVTDPASYDSGLLVCVLGPPSVERMTIYHLSEVEKRLSALSNTPNMMAGPIVLKTMSALGIPDLAAERRKCCR